MWIISICIFLAMVMIQMSRKLLDVGEPQTWTKLKWTSCHFQNGDLLFLSRGDSFYFRRIFGESFWTHVALVYEDPITSTLYAWEAMMGDSSLPVSSASYIVEGPRLIPLYKWIDKNLREHGDTLGWRAIQYPLDQDRKVLFGNFVLDNLNKHYRFAHDFLMDAWQRFWTPMMFFRLPYKCSKRRYCASLVGHTLEHLHLISRHIDHGENYVPNDFTHDSLDCLDGYRYSPMMEIVN